VNWSNLDRKLSFNDVNRRFDEIASGKTGQQVNRGDLIVEKSAIPYGQW
jgi:hypothetical protein